MVAILQFKGQPKVIAWLVAVLKAGPRVPHPQVVSVPNTVALAEVLVVMGLRIVPVKPVAPLYSVLVVGAEEDKRAETLQGLAEFGVRIPKVEARRLELLIRPE